MPHVSKCHYCHSTAVVNSLWKCTQGVCMCVCWCFVYANKVIRLFNFHARVLPEMSSLGRHQHWNLVPVMRTYTDDDRRCVLSECKQCTNKTSDVAAAAAGLFGLWMFTCLLWFPSQSVRKMDDWGTNEKKKWWWKNGSKKVRSFTHTAALTVFKSKHHEQFCFAHFLSRFSSLQIHFWVQSEHEN